MGVQVHLRYGDGDYNDAYANIKTEDDKTKYPITDEDDVTIHAKGSCDRDCHQKEEPPAIDYNLTINKPKINGHTLIGNLDSRVLGLEISINAYAEKHKVKDYLYEIYYNELDYDYACDYFIKNKVNLSLGACSAVRKGNFYGRNFDWIYDESASFIVRIPRIGNRFASMGITGSESRLTNEIAGTNDYNEAYKILPFKVVDGINEYGVIANSNVVPNDKGVNTESIPIIEKRETICNLMLVRYILDNFKSAQEAVEYIRNYVAIYPVKALEDMHYELHVMVADDKKTYILEIVDNRVVIKDISNKPYMTNFYLDGVTFNDDGKTYYPAINDAEHNAKITNGVTDNGSGLERYAKIVDAYDGLNDINSMMNFMSQDLKYTKAYEGGDPDGIGEWYTEFVGNGLSVASNPEDFSNIILKSKEAYQHRSRDPKSQYYGTWQTTHTSVYDMKNRTVDIIVQEDGERLKYYYNALIDTQGEITADYNLLINKPQINEVELKNKMAGQDLKLVNSDDFLTNREIEELLRAQL